MRKWIYLTVCFCMSPSWVQQAAADTYRGELSFGYLTGEVSVSGSSPGYTPPPVDGPGEPPVGTPPIEPPPLTPGSIDEDYSGWQISGEHFLEPVDASVGPRRLAPFLARASSIGGRYSEIETDDSNLDTETWQAFTRLVFNSWVVEGAFGQAETSGGIVDDEVDLYRAAVGYYIASNTQVRIAYDGEDIDGAAGSELDMSRWAIDIEHVQQLENGMTWHANLLYGHVRGDAAIGDDDGADIEARFSWFFNDRFGAGADYVMNDRDQSGDTDGWQVWTNYFPTDKISLSLSYFSEDNDDFDAENDGVVFEARYRY